MSVYHVTLFVKGVDGILKKCAGTSFVAPKDASVSDLRSMAFAEVAVFQTTWHVGVIETLDPGHRSIGILFGFLHYDLL